MSIVFFVVLTAIFIFLQRKLYEAAVFKKLEIGRKFDAPGIFPGESVEFELDVANRKLLPVTWLSMEQWMPAGLQLEHREASSGNFAVTVSNTGSLRYEFDSTFSVGPFQKIKRKYRLTGLKRGYFEFAEGVKLVSADLLGSVKIEALKSLPLRLAIYPRLLDARNCLVPARSLQGDFFVNRNIAEDPLMVAGIREYTGVESMRNINWKATARHAEILVNRFEHTADRKVILLLYLPDNYRPESKSDEAAFEAAVEAAASIAYELMEEGIPVGFATNALCLVEGGDQAILPGLNEGHREELLTLLSSMAPFSRTGFDTQFQAIRQRLPGDTDMAIIAMEADDGLLDTLDSIKGARLSLILTREILRHHGGKDSQSKYAPKKNDLEKEKEIKAILGSHENVDIYLFDGEAGKA